MDKRTVTSREIYNKYVDWPHREAQGGTKLGLYFIYLYYFIFIYPRIQKKNENRYAI